MNRSRGLASIVLKRVRGPGTRVAVEGVVRHEVRQVRLSSQSGLTLIELLVVIAIIGLITSIVTLQVNQYYQRSRLEGQAMELRGFLLSAQTLAMGTSDRVVVRYQESGGRRWFELVPVRPPGSGSNLSSMQTVLELPSYLVLNGLGLGSGAIDWHQFPANVHNVVCSPMMRAQEETGTNVFQDLASLRTLRLTHTSIVEGRLAPRTVFEIEISPLWNVRVQRRIAP